MAHVEFTGNYQDLSTDKGYQFKFFCERCNNGYMSSFQSSKIGMATSAVEVASNLFGGLFSRVASSAYEVQRAIGGPAHDAALADAVAEIKPLFRQCTRCGQWVCEPVCFNKSAGLCEQCAPDLAEETAAAKAAAARDQVFQKAQSIDWLKGHDVAAAPAAVCPACGAKTQGGKFCPDCGASLAAKKKCPGCGHEAEGNPRFCPDCGQKL